MLGRLGDATAQDRLEATVEQVEKLGLKDLVRDMQFAALANLGERAGAMDEKDYGKLVDRLKGFLHDGPIDSARPGWPRMWLWLRSSPTAPRWQ